jgi:hypothetical protein
MIYSITSDAQEGIWNIEVGPGYWYVDRYYLHAQVGGILFTTHVGLVPYDNTKPIKIRLEVPVIKGE